MPLKEGAKQDCYGSQHLWRDHDKVERQRARQRLIRFRLQRLVQVGHDRRFHDTESGRCAGDGDCQGEHKREDVGIGE